MSDQPRWEIRITPADGAPFGNANINLFAHVDDVTLGEVAYSVLKVAGHLGDPREAQVRIPTTAEVQDRAFRAEILQKYPATRLFIRNGEQVWLSEEGLSAGVDTEPPTDPGDGENDEYVVPLREELDRHNWTDAGSAPAEVKRPCDFFLDEGALLAKIRA